MKLLNQPSIWNVSLGYTSLRLFLCCWLVYTIHFATNTVREIYPALSLGDHFSFDVKEYLGLHPDIFEIPGKGAYINNNPGASILGAVPYFIFRPLILAVSDRIAEMRAASGFPIPEYESIYPMAREFYRKAYRLGLDVKFGLAAGVMQAFLMAPLSALCVVVMFRMLKKMGTDRKSALVLSLLFAFATPVFYRTAQLNHNLLQAIFAFLAFSMMWFTDPSVNNQRTRLAYLSAGLLSGWTVVLDYSGIILITALGVYAALNTRKITAGRQRWQVLVLFAVGLILSASVLNFYQWLVFGSPFYPAQHYMPATTYSSSGYRGMDWPQADLLWELAFGIRYGLFISAPFLILALVPTAWTRAWVRLLERWETLWILILSVAFLLFTSANQFSRMQFNSGVRHLLPVVPFLFLIAAGQWLKLGQVLKWVTAIAGTYWSWCLAMYRDVEQEWGIFDSLVQVTAHGPRFPWLETVVNLGYVEPGWRWLVLVILIISICLIWLIRIPGKQGEMVPVSHGG